MKKLQKLARISFLFIPLLLFVVSCKSSITSVIDFNEWLNDDDNGCIRTREVNGGKVTIKYQPPAYLLLKEVEKGNYTPYNKLKYSQLINGQDGFITFLMTVGPEDGAENKKTLSYDGKNFGEYVDQTLASNFLMSNYLSLFIGDKKCQYIGSNVENLYELSMDRNFIVIFENPYPDKKMSADYLFVFDDPFFKMGKMQFSFPKEAIEASKQLDIKWNQ